MVSLCTVWDVLALQAMAADDRCILDLPASHWHLNLRIHFAVPNALGFRAAANCPLRIGSTCFGFHPQVSPFHRLQYMRSPDTVALGFVVTHNGSESNATAGRNASKQSGP